LSDERDSGIFQDHSDPASHLHVGARGV